MDALQLSLRPLLREHGFRVQGRTFNRKTPDGLTHVVAFQMGRSDPPGTVYVPGLTQNLYGKFTVSLGVYVPEVPQYHLGNVAGKFVQDYHCCVRARLGEVGPEQQDIWWELQENPQLDHEIQQRLLRDALPFLERFNTRDALLKELSNGMQHSASDPPRIVSAIILAVRGRLEDAKLLLEAQIRGSQRNPRHPDYVRGLASKLGISSLNA